MTSIPEDFWNALKSGNTSDGLFWAAIAIIIGVLFLLLSIARCIMWCCGTTNKAESVGSEAQNLQPDRRPVDWPNNFQEPQPPTRQNQQQKQAYQPYQQYNGPPPNAMHPTYSQPGWSAHGQPPYVQNPAYNSHAAASPAHYEHVQPAPAHGYWQQQPQGLYNQPHAQHPQHAGFSQHAGSQLAPAYPSKSSMKHQGSIRWSKEDFESVFSDKASVDMMHCASSPPGHSPDDKPLLQQPAPQNTPPAAGLTRQPSGKRAAAGSPTRNSSPSKAGVRMAQKPPKRNGASPDKHGSPQRGAGFHVHVEDMFKNHVSMHEPEESAESNRPNVSPLLHQQGGAASHPKRSGSVQSMHSMHSTPPSVAPSIPSKIYNTKTPSVYSPSEYTQSERTTQSHTPSHVPTPPRGGSGSPPLDAVAANSPPWGVVPVGSSTPPAPGLAAVPSKIYNTATPSPSPGLSTPPDVKGVMHQGMGGAHHVVYAAQSRDAKRGSVRKLQPPLPVSPRVASLSDNAVAQQSCTPQAGHAAAAVPPQAAAAEPVRSQPHVDRFSQTPQQSTPQPPPQPPAETYSPPLPGHAAPPAAAVAGVTRDPHVDGRGLAAGSAEESDAVAAQGAVPQSDARLPTAIGIGMQHQQEDVGNRFSACDTGESAVFGFPKAVNPTAYAAMYDIMLNSKTTGGLSASKSQGFHLEAELMLMGGGAGDSDCSLHEPRDLGQVNIDNTHTVAAVECTDDATLSEFLGLTRQRHVQAQFVDKTVDRNDRALSLAVWDLGVRFYKLRRREEAQFAIMRRMHRLPTSPESRFWKQAIDIDFEANSYHPALGCKMTVSGTEEVILVEIANQSGMWLDLRLPPQPPPGVTHERWVKLVMQEGSVVCLPKGCTYMLAMPENGMVGLLRARIGGAST